jgi:hypothetical protein
MEKIIKLVMCENKNLTISVNDEEKHTIDAQNRSISADKIYEMIDFAVGDHYTVISENESGVENQVLEFFTSLFTNIVDKVNMIDVGDDNSVTM